MKVWRPIVDTYQGGASKRFAFVAVVLGVLLVAALAFVFTVLPGMAVSGDGLTTDERLQREGDARTAGLQALAGLVVALGGAFTAFSVLSNREGQLDERFGRALELLASDDPYIARGAVYSLERIAVQSGFDRDAVTDVLVAFVKDRVPDGAEDGSKRPPVRQEALDALIVLSRIKELWRSPTPNLDKTYWSGAKLNFRKLSGISFSESSFVEADFSDADLRDANMLRADLRFAQMSDTDLRGAYLSWVDLRDAYLFGVRFEGARLHGADLRETYFDETTQLRGTTFAMAKLEGARFRNTDLSEALLDHADFAGAKYWPETKFPPGFDPVSKGMVLQPAENGGSNSSGDF